MADDDSHHSDESQHTQNDSQEEAEERSESSPLPSSFANDMRSLPAFTGDSRRGSVSANNFFRALDIYAKEHDWNGKVKKAALYRKLADFPRTLINNSLDIDYENATYEELKDFLLNRCTSNMTQTQRDKLFANCVMSSNDTIDTFAKRLEDIAVEIMLNSPEFAGLSKRRKKLKFNALIVTQFKKGLPKPLKGALLSSEFDKFIDLILATKRVADYYSDHEFIYQNEESDSNIRALLLDDDDVKSKKTPVKKSYSNTQEAEFVSPLKHCCHSQPSTQQFPQNNCCSLAACNSPTLNREIRLPQSAPNSDRYPRQVSFARHNTPPRMSNHRRQVSCSDLPAHSHTICNQAQANYSNDMPVNLVHFEQNKFAPQHLVTADQHMQQVNRYNNVPQVNVQSRPNYSYNQGYMASNGQGPRQYQLNPNYQHYNTRFNNRPDIANSSGKNNYQNGYRQYSNNYNNRGQNNGYNAANNGRGGYLNARVNNPQARRDNVVCYFCQEPNHTVRTCEKLKANYLFCGFCGLNSHAMVNCDAYKNRAVTTAQPGPSVSRN